MLDAKLKLFIKWNRICLKINIYNYKYYICTRIEKMHLNNRKTV